MATTPTTNPFRIDHAFSAPLTPAAAVVTGLCRPVASGSTFTIPATIPTPSILDTEPMDPSVDYAPEWDHDTDTLASYVAWKIEFESLQTGNRVTQNLLAPIAEFIRKEVSHQLTQHAVMVRIPDLQEMKDRELEMQKHICTLTDTITKLSEQVTKLSTCPATTVTAPAARAMAATPQTH